MKAHLSLRLRSLATKIKYKSKNTSIWILGGGMEALVYTPDFETLRGICPDWPEEVFAILCLHQSGRCDLHLRHVEEDAAEALSMAVTATDEGSCRVYVVPASDGYPTRRLSFSEEQAICGLLDGVDQLPDLALEYALSYRYRKEAAETRELGERANSLAERLRHRERSEGGPTGGGERKLVASVSEAEGYFCLVVGGGDLASASGREVFGRVVDVPLRGSSVRLAWDGDVTSGDVILIPGASLPPAAAALWRRGNTSVRLKFVADGAVVDPEIGDGQRTGRLARAAAVAFLISSAGILTAGVAAAFG
jgi:hypothetical protein